MQTIKKQGILMASFALALVLIAMPLILAEENESTEENPILIQENTGNANESDSGLEEITEEEVDEGLNESVNGLKLGWKRVGIWFTLNPEEKAKKELDLARLRLIQAKIAAKNGNLIAMEKALQAHERNLERARERINAMNGASDKNGTLNSAEKLVGLERAIQVHERRVERLNDLLAEDNNLTEEQVLQIQEKIAKAENSTEHLKEVQEAKMDRVKTKLMAVENITEEEAEDEINDRIGEAKMNGKGRRN